MQSPLQHYLENQEQKYRHLPVYLREGQTNAMPTCIFFAFSPTSSRTVVTKSPSIAPPSYSTTAFSFILLFFQWLSCCSLHRKSSQTIVYIMDDFNNHTMPSTAVKHYSCPPLSSLHPLVVTSFKAR